MKTQIRLLGTIDVLYGVYLMQFFAGFFESVNDFIQHELAMTLIIVGLLIGGAGLWAKLKIGWIVNQLIWIHLTVSYVVGLILTVTSYGQITNNETFFDIFRVLALIVLFSSGLYWTSRRQWLDEFSISDKLRLLTISGGVLFSLVFLIKSYA